MSNVRPSAKRRTARSAGSQASARLPHKSESRLLVAVARMCCRGSISPSLVSPRSVQERSAWASALLGVAEVSTFCGPASGQPGNCHASPAASARYALPSSPPLVGRLVIPGKPSKCKISPSFRRRAGSSRVLRRCQFLGQVARFQLCPPGHGLTPPSRGRPQAGCARLWPPLTSNVRAHQCSHSLRPS